MNISQRSSNGGSGATKINDFNVKLRNSKICTHIK